MAEMAWRLVLSFGAGQTQFARERQRAKTVVRVQVCFFHCAILRLALSMFGCRMATELLSARSLLVDQGIALNAQYIDMY